MRDTDGTYVTVNGLSLAYRRAGSGHPLVLLHGGFEDGRIWRRQLDFLSDEFATFAWDAPGAGGSDDPPPGFTSADYADAVAGFIEALGLDTAHLLGSSWGSTLALATYERHRPSCGHSCWLRRMPAGPARCRLQRCNADGIR